MVETTTANIYIEDDIVFLIYKEKVDVDVFEIEENLKAKAEI